MSSLRNVAMKFYLTDFVQTVIKAGVDAAGRDQAIVSRYLRDHSPAGLHIGAGGNIRKGWLNTNWYPIRPWAPRAIFMDATKRFPLPDNSFDFIFTEHMIEHVPYNDAQIMLRESFRVLKPGGTIRISTPDMAFLLDLLSPNLTDTQKSYVEWASTCFLKNGQPHTALSVVNNFVRDWGHTYIYDRPTLEAALDTIGFVSIASCKVNESRISGLNGIDHPERFPNKEFLALESMVYEALKPSAH